MDDDLEKDFVEGDSSDDLFPLERADRDFIVEVNKHVRSLLQRPDIAPKDILSISRLLLGLERLPSPTPGLSLRLQLSYIGSVCEVFLSDSSIYIGRSSFEYVDGPHGGDSVYDEEEIYSAELGGGRADNGFMSAMSWLEDLENRVVDAELHIEDDSTHDELDWDNADGSAFWDQLLD